MINLAFLGSFMEPFYILKLIMKIMKFISGGSLLQYEFVSYGDNSEYMSDQIIIYNRIPKTGSTSFIGLGYSLCFTNKFNVIHINTTKNVPTLPLTDQVSLSLFKTN